MKGVIYKITNKLNNKKYIGKTGQNPDEYWLWHIQQSKKENNNKYLYRAMRKYGVDNFDFKIIEEIYSDNVDILNGYLNEREKYWIKELDTFKPNGYNLTLGGDGLLGLKFTDEHRRKISEFYTGKKRPPEVVEKMRQRKIPLEQRKKMSETRKMRKIPSPNKGKHLSDETKQKLRESKLGKCNGENNPFYGKHHSEETKEILRNKNKEYSNREEVLLNNKLKQPHRIRVGMCDKDTMNIIKTFESIKDAVKWIANNTKYKGDSGTIKDAINLKRVSYGYRWIKLN